MTVLNDRISVNEHLVENYGEDSCVVFMHKMLCERLAVDACMYLPEAIFTALGVAPAAYNDTINDTTIHCALEYLVVMEQLNIHYQYIDKEDNAFDIDKETLLDARKTGKMCHPESGVIVIVFDNNISVYYSVTDNLKEQLAPNEPQTGIFLTHKETATVLAALRHWQEVPASHNVMQRYNEDGHFHDHDPLTNDEIDNLCERINTA